MPDHENILTPPLMLVRYAGMASLLTTVWESRRKLQDRNAELKRRVADLQFYNSGAESWIDELEDLHRPSGVLALRKRVAELEIQRDRVTDLFEKWASEESEQRTAGYYGIAEGLHVAIEDLREAVHASKEMKTNA